MREFYYKTPPRRGPSLFDGKEERGKAILSQAKSRCLEAIFGELHRRKMLARVANLPNFPTRANNNNNTANEREKQESLFNTIPKKERAADLRALHDY